MHHHTRLKLAAAAAVACIAFAAGCRSTPELVAPPQGAAISNPHQYDDEWFAAARLGRIDILKALLEAGYPIDSTTDAGYTALILSAYDDQPAALDFLMQAGANPCLGDKHGNTALMGALFKGELPIARSLMNTHCAIDQTNNAGETALSFAALFGRLTLLPELVSRGANPDHTDAHGGTALQMAEAQGNRAAANALRKVGATR
ncbi:ankyrin repeat domain-containing protein [Paraburkholderia megapolitana]|uniref:ankyrin repeat domain-containing protein n=1 Tax=Paraburkholderia megapolitana TaxID=420953 RepID=UPI0038BBCB74